MLPCVMNVVFHTSHAENLLRFSFILLRLGHLASEQSTKIGFDLTEIRSREYV
jgi:hypothetical protein